MNFKVDTKMTKLNNMPTDELESTYEKNKRIGIILIIVGLLTCCFGVGVILIFIGIGYIHSSNAYKREMESRRPLEDYIIFDLETTGLNPNSDKIIEVGAIKIVGGEVADTFSSFINPMKNISKRATAINGITNEMVQDAPIETDIIPEFGRFLVGYALVAYNINFDLGFLNAALQRCGMQLNPGGTIDALKVSKQYFHNIENYKLGTVVKAIDPDYEQTHRALDDCYAIKKILDHTGVAYSFLQQF